MATPTSSSTRSPSVPPTTPPTPPYTGGRGPTPPTTNPDTMTPPPAKPSKSYWTKCLEGISKIPYLGPHLARCFGLTITRALPNPPAPPLTAEQREANAKGVIIGAFASATPNEDAVRTHVTLFRSLNLAAKLDVVRTLQTSAHCTHAVLIQFINALAVTGTNNPLEQLQQHIEHLRQTGETRTGAALLAENTKSALVMAAVAAYIDARRTESDTQKKTLILNTFNLAQTPAAGALKNAIPVFTSIETPKCKWQTLLDLMKSQHMTRALMLEFAATLPQDLRDQLHARVEQNARLERVRIAHENATLTRLRQQAAATGQPAPTRQNSPMPPTVTGAVYFGTSPTSDVVAHSLHELIVVLP